MSCIHPLFDSKIEEVSPPQLARALGFSVEDSCDFPFENEAFEALHAVSTDEFYRVWRPGVSLGYTLAGAYESEDGPYAFGVKPETLFAMILWKWANETNMGMELTPASADTEA